VHEAVSIPGTEGHDPDFPDDPQYEVPEYVVSGLNCAFTDANNSSAACSFDLTAGAKPPQPVNAVLTHRFFARVGLLTFGYGTRWSTAASCLPHGEAE
jgi:hypothetical protein